MLNINILQIGSNINSSILIWQIIISIFSIIQWSFSNRCYASTLGIFKVQTDTMRSFG